MQSRHTGRQHLMECEKRVDDGSSVLVPTTQVDTRMEIWDPGSRVVQL